MKKLILLATIFFISIITYGQTTELEDDAKKLKIINIVKIIDSIGKEKKEGIIEGVNKYSHGKNRSFGWDAYYLTDENTKNPLRIRYGETKPNETESLNLYYQNGTLIFGELKSMTIDKKSKPIKEITKKFYFENRKIISPEDITDSNIDYILEKEKMLTKNIYK